MYEYLANRPVPEKKDSHPGSRANNLNAPEKSGDKKFSLSDAGIQYDPRKTAQLKAHAFTKSSAAPKKATPRGVIQRAVWIYHTSNGQWEKISRMDEKGDNPFPANPVDGAYFNDVTGEYCTPEDPMYAEKFQELMQRRYQRAGMGYYSDSNKLSAYAQNPVTGIIKTPFDEEGIHSGMNKIGKNNYVVFTKGAGKSSLNYRNIKDANIPKGAYIAAAKNMSAPPDAPIVHYDGPLSNKQKAVMTGYFVIQHDEELRSPTGGTFPTAVTNAIAQNGFEEVLKNCPYMQDGGTKLVKRYLTGENYFDKNQAKLFLPNVPPSPQRYPEPVYVPPEDYNVPLRKKLQPQSDQRPPESNKSDHDPTNGDDDDGDYLN